MRRSILVCATTAAVLAGALPGGAQDLPEYTCARVKAPPVIDGRGDDAAWQAAEAVSLVDVKFLSGDRRHSRPTQVQMVWDDDQLYVLFTATDPDVWSTLAQRDDPLWDQEVVEIFMDPNGDRANYVEIEVNPLNTIVDLLVTLPFRDGGEGMFGWSPEYTTATYVDGTVNDPGDTDASWSMELALPWALLREAPLDVLGERRAPPDPGDHWRINFYRYERLRDGGRETGVIEYSAWSPVGRVDFHVPERFGIVTFAGAVTAVEGVTWGGVKGESDGRGAR